MDFVIVVLLTALQNILDCHGASLKEQLEHIASAKMESEGYPNLGGYRRFISFHPGETAAILGAPSMPSHLPEAEPILPGHTLIRPALGMLKSSVKFPHRDWENGGGVYGNIDSLSITWGGTNERVLYTGFRRMGGDNDEPSPSGPKSLILILTNNSDEDDSEPEFHTRQGAKRKRKRSKKRKKLNGQELPAFWELPMKKQRESIWLRPISLTSLKNGGESKKERFPLGQDKYEKKQLKASTKNRDPKSEDTGGGGFWFDPKKENKKFTSSVDKQRKVNKNRELKWDEIDKQPKKNKRKVRWDNPGVFEPKGKKKRRNKKETVVSNMPPSWLDMDYLKSPSGRDRSGKRRRKRSRKNKKEHKGYPYNTKSLQSEIQTLKGRDLSYLNYDGLSKALRDPRRYEMPTSHEHNFDSSTEIEIEDINPPKDNDPHPKLTWFWGSKDSLPGFIQSLKDKSGRSRFD